MKMKFTLRMMLTGSCCAICYSGMMSATPADAQAARSKAVRTLTQMLTPDRQNKNRHTVSSVSALPAVIQKYDWLNDDWSMLSTIMRYYTPEGRISLESEVDVTETVIRETEYTYDMDGNISTEVESLWNESRQMLMPATRIRYEYDTVVKDFCIKKVTETYNGAGWLDGASETWRVTRNSDGNVTEVLYSENGKDTEKQCMEYGADGKANKITGYDYNGVSWELSSIMSDIEWLQTNGQLLISDEDFFFFMSGNNRIKRCVLEQYDSDWEGEDGMMDKLTFNLTYAENGSFTGTVDGAMEGMSVNGSTMSYTVLENGGHDYNFTLKMSMGFYSMSIETIWKTEYDAWHNCLTEIDCMKMDGEYDYEVYKKGEVTYSSTTGLPETYIVKELDYDSYDEEQPVTDADFVNVEKYEFSEYSASGITEVTSDRGDDDVLYDLSGCRIARPHTGQPYIKNGRKYIGK